jgi:hypothetical protein
LGFFWHEGASSTSAKKAQITQERVEFNVFFVRRASKGSKSLKIFKISLTFHFDKLSNLSKSVHTGENSQILTVSNKKTPFLGCFEIKLVHFCLLFVVLVFSVVIVILYRVTIND